MTDHASASGVLSPAVGHVTAVSGVELVGNRLIGGGGDGHGAHTGEEERHRGERAHQRTRTAGRVPRDHPAAVATCTTALPFAISG